MIVSSSHCEPHGKAFKFANENGGILDCAYGKIITMQNATDLSVNDY